MYLLILNLLALYLNILLYLHPTMYLLIRLAKLSPVAPLPHLHPTMYLLIRRL